MAIDDTEETQWHLVIYETNDTAAEEPRVKAELQGETKRHRTATDAQRDSTHREYTETGRRQKVAEVVATSQETKEPSQRLVRSGMLIIAGMIVGIWLYRRLKRN